MKDYAIPVIKKGFVLVVKSAGIALVSVVILLFIGRAINAKTEEIIKARSEFSAFTKKYELFDQLKKDSEFAEQNKAKLDNALPSVDHLTMVSDYLNSVASKTSNIATIHFGITVSTNELEVSEISFSISNIGTFQSLTDLLDEIENAPYFMGIKNISLSFQDGIAGQTSASLTGVAYLKNINDEN